MLWQFLYLNTAMIKNTFSNRDGSRASDEHAATNQQLPSFPCVTSWLLMPSTNNCGASGVQMSYMKINNSLKAVRYKNLYYK